MLLLKALPELISAAILLAIWVEPLRFGADGFRSGVLTLRLAFLWPLFARWQGRGDD